MTDEKRLALKRAVIFTVIVLFLGIVPFALVSFVFKADDNSGVNSLIGTLAMFTPAAANILTRLITKEGMENTMLLPKFSGNVRLYIIAGLAAVLYSAADTIICLHWLDSSFTVGFFLGENSFNTLIALLSCGISVTINMVVYFGEEFGWRGYLAPKLERVFGTFPSVLITGVIWGLWHCSNFFGMSLADGAEAALSQTIFCTMICGMFVYFTRRTGSIIPAIFIHSIYNNLRATIIALFMHGRENAEALSEQLLHEPMYLGLAASFIVFAFFTAMLLFEKKLPVKTENAGS